MCRHECCAEVKSASTGSIRFEQNSVMHRGLNQRWRNFGSLVETGLAASKMTSNAERMHTSLSSPPHTFLNPTIPNIYAPLCSTMPNLLMPCLTTAALKVLLLPFEQHSSLVMQNWNYFQDIAKTNMIQIDSAWWYLSICTWALDFTHMTLPGKRPTPTEVTTATLSSLVTPRMA